jgi:hypothetical protein
MSDGRERRDRDGDGPIVDRDAVLVPRREESGGAKLMGMGERFPL